MTSRAATDRPVVPGPSGPADWPGGGTGWPDAVPEPSRRLIEAAIDAFAEHGYHATTTRDIATRVGLSPAGLYVHFPSKAALLARISRLGHEAAAELVERAIATSNGPVQRVRAVVAGFATWHAEHHRMARIVQHELSALPTADLHVVMGLRQRIEQAMEAQVTEGVSAGLMTVDDPHAVSRALLSLSVDVARWYDPDGSETPERIGALYADLATRMVGATP